MESCIAPKVAKGLYDVVETEWEHSRGAPDEVFWGERLYPGKLRHNIGERECEVTQVFPGRLGSREGAELALEPPVVEVEELVASGGAGPRCMYPQLLKRLGDCVEADGGERLDGGVNFR